MQTELNTNKLLENMSSIRRWCWPILNHELSKFLPLFLMKFCVSFNYTVLNTTKDTIVVTASGSGAEVIPALKGGVVILMAFVVMLLYSKLSNMLSRTRLFYTIVTPFIIFFLLFGVFLFPFRDLISPHSSADFLLNLIGEQHKHWINVYRYWMNSMFFVAAELWGGLMIGVLFWGFANQITSVKDAARFYVLYTAGGHLGTIAGGSLIYMLSKFLHTYSFNLTVQILMLIVSFTGAAIIGLYWWTNKYVVMRSINAQEAPEQNRNLNSKTRLSIKDSILYIARSPYLGMIALMVIGYGLSVSLVEVTWKAILQLQYPDSNSYQSYMGVQQTLLGVVSLIVAVFLGGNIMRKYGWYISAQLTPLVLGFTSLMFFAAFFLCPDFASSKVTIFGFTPLMILVLTGSVHNIACKAMKYCLFDPTKEIAFIPLDQESKVKGKAAVDLVGARFGKSGSSWLQLALIDFVGAGSILGVAVYLIPCLVIVVTCWLFAVNNLNKHFQGLQNFRKQRKVLAAQAF